ncbi:FecCD family ABC transporter permease [Aestuariispira insulae]|uniref:Iron complex transport system permease protein n=1 Tax=Aestuariispira insulae TaxID=1461337 RepID=A0A3D9H5R1_9PROT|nr:iron ABC transporter permease [Aestuariispira insulae]RED44850.1 iron complex transport system permease protein [Aestuariispira insulae]
MREYETTARSWRPWLMLAGLLTAVTLAVFLGAAGLTAGEVWTALMGEGDRRTDTIISHIRLPRVLTGMVIGLHFALSGALLQAVTRNPLADPTILGVSQGATLAVMIFLLITVYWDSTDGSILFAIPVEYLSLVGCAGGLVAGLAVFLLSMRGGLSPMRLTLMGIALGAVLHALALGILAGWGSTRVESLLMWMSGSLYARGWQHLLYLLPWTVLAFGCLPLLRRPIGLLQLDDAAAASFGLSVQAYRSLVLAVAAGLAASAVGVVGPVGFVGLVVPHLARFLAGPDGRFYLAMVALLGAGLTVGADLLGRTIMAPGEVPVGVVTTLLGAPFFLFLLRRYG